MTNEPPFSTATSFPWASLPRTLPHTTPHTTLPAGYPCHDPVSEHRLAMLKRKEPTQRLVREVIAIRRLRKLSQATLA